jgi:nucleoside diphosphate kinase
VTKEYVPDSQTGKPRRVMLLLFEGEDAVQKIWSVTGSATLKAGSGETIRDTYGDYVLDGQDSVHYFEPAVLVAPTRERAAASLQLWAQYSEGCGGVISMATDVPEGQNVQGTVVMLKPDIFRSRSLKPGSIIDILSSSGLRIIAVKKFSMTVAQAEAFYAPVKEALSARFPEFGARRTAEALGKEFGFQIPEALVQSVCGQLAPLYAAVQFESIVEFVSGYKPSQCPEREKDVAGKEECFALVYEGVDGVRKIREILGSTDPSKARPGSVRREFGSDIMVNAAHASDSPENALREMDIIDFKDDTIRPWVDRYYGSPLSRMTGALTSDPRERRRFRRRMTRLTGSEPS